MFIGFVDHESMEIYTKIVFLTGIEAQNIILQLSLEAILLLTSKTNSSRMPSWHPPDSDSGMVQDDESTKKVHNNANACFFRIPLDYTNKVEIQCVQDGCKPGHDVKNQRSWSMEPYCFQCY